MVNFLFRLYALLCSLVLGLWLHAQRQDYDERFGRGRHSEEFGFERDYDSGPLISFGWEDIVFFVILLGACYVFGKIWKGCTYLLVIVAAIMFYLTH